VKLLHLAVAAGLISGTGAQASIIVYNADLSGPAEAPPNASPGSGFASVTIDNIAHTMRVELTFSGLLGTTTASHIHCCTTSPGTGTGTVATTVPTFAGFPLGVTSGSYDSGLLDLTSASSYNPAFVTASGGTTALAEAALLAGMAADKTYLNIHTSVVPGGEIRGFLTPQTSTPEPTTLFLVGGVLAGFALRRKIRV
jgi:hypothetical protein